MITALALLGYAACAGWGAPALLAPLTRRGVSVRAGLAAWLTAMASAVIAVMAAIGWSLAAVAAQWPRLTVALCRSVAGRACTPQVYDSVFYQAGLLVLVGALTTAVAAAAWRCGRRVQRSRARTRSHARTALLVGRSVAALPVTASPGGPAGTGARTVMLDDPRPAAYCVAGRPAAIVVTSGALAVLSPGQLRAVLAHERAHLAQGHHVLATVTGGLAAAVPGVPLFARGAAEVARLAEMAADDTAAAASGRSALVAALIAIATGTAIPSAGLAAPAVPPGAAAAAACAVPDRVERLLAPPTSARAAAVTAVLAVFLTVLAVAPAALALLSR